MDDAVNSVQNDDVAPATAAKKHGVPRTSLLRQLDGIKSSDQQSQPAQRLSPSQEESIATWILRQEKLGYAPTASLVRNLATSILKKNGDMQPLGKNWIASFKKRNPQVWSKMGRKQEAERFSNFTPKSVN